MADETVGIPFSRVYLKPVKPLRESVKFRRRLSSYIWTATKDSKFDPVGHLKSYYGLQVPFGPHVYNWTTFFESGDFADVLDAITAVYHALGMAGRLDGAQQWKAFVSRALAEELLGYKLDEQCAVRIYVDEEFERTRSSTLVGLGRDRYAAAKAAYERGLKALDGTTADTLHAVCGIFEATEEVFKLMFPKAARLGSAEIGTFLRPFVGTRYQPPALNAVNKMVSSFADWVDGMHTYRHAQGVEDPSPPPLGVAVLVIGVGSTFLRWLIELDTSRSALEH